MPPTEAIWFMFLSACFGLSLFFGAYLILAKDFVREEWRQSFRRYKRFSFSTFTRIVRGLGFVFLLICVGSAIWIYWTIARG